MSKSDKEQINNIYRYKFDVVFMLLIEDYARKHRYDEPGLFYDSWLDWVKDNIDVIEREKHRLEALGYMVILMQKCIKVPDIILKINH